MLAPVTKEVSMSEQRLLFDPHRSIWVERLWQRIDAETRGTLISILVQMARSSLTASAQPPAEQEHSDES